MKSYNGEKAKEVFGDKQVPFVLMSKGIGKKFALENKKQLEENLGVMVNGHMMSLPRYYQKILEIPIDKIQNNAILREEKLVEYYEKRGIVEDRDKRDYGLISQLKSNREQAERNAKARLNLRNKGDF